MRPSLRASLALSALLAAALAGAPIAAAATTPKGTSSRDGPSGRYQLEGGWYLRADPAGTGIRDGLPKNASLAGWGSVSVPAAANAGDFSVPSYMGSVNWYRTDFRLPRSRAGTGWRLRFESVNHRARVWLNGVYLGSHTGAYLPFELRGRSIRKGVNRLVVRVDSRRSWKDIPPLTARANGTFEGGWWNYNGILREVYLRKVTKLDFAHVFVRPRLRCRRCAATVTIDARVANVTRQRRRARVVGTFGGKRLSSRVRRVRRSGSRRFRMRLRVRKPRLWEPGHPSLYTLRLSLTDQRGRVLQRYKVRTGIRSIRVTGHGRIVLNGRQVNLRGAAIHEDSPDRGAALTTGQMDRIFQNLRDVGATITRAHYPLSPYELELADRYGIVVWSEVPVYRMASALFDSKRIRARAVRMVRENVKRDYNHPSVMVWSLGNENASRPKYGLREYIELAARTVRRMDPTRLVGMAIAGYPTVGTQKIYRELDAIGVNDYFGWYTGPAGSIADATALSAYLDQMHSYYPRQALMVTEVGAEANRHGPDTEKGTYEFQANFLAYHLEVFALKQYVNAGIVWALQDFRVKPGWTGGNPLPNPPVNEKGLIDDSGFRKPGFYVVRDVYDRTGPFR